MKKLDILEIQNLIEEKRLILGRKIEQFLLEKVYLIIGFLKVIFAKKSSAFFGCFFIVILSLLLQSTHDLGHDSAAYIDIATRILNGGKYYFDFIENNLPFVFYLTAIPISFAKSLDVNPIIPLEIFVNFIGIFSIYYSYKILQRSELLKDQLTLNILIWSFTWGFFLRVYTLHFNEFATKSTYFLAFLYPYISYHLIDQKKLKNCDQIIVGILAAMIFWLKPHYGILVIFFEIQKLFKVRSIKPVFCLRNYVTSSLLIGYLLFIYFFIRDYIEAIPYFSALYFHANFFEWFLLLHEDFYPVLLLIILFFSLVQKDAVLKFFSNITIVIALMIFVEIIGGFDQRFIFYSLSASFLSLLILLAVRGGYINWKRDAIVLLIIVILPQFDQKTISNLAIDIPVFWWIFVIVLSIQWNKKISDKKFFDGLFLNQIFLLRDIRTGIFFLILASATIYLSSYKSNKELVWVTSALIFAFLLRFNQSLYEKFFNTKQFSTLTSSIIFAVLSYHLSLVSVGIFDVKNSATYSFRSPSYVNDQLTKNIKTYAPNDEIVVIGKMIPSQYPVITYLEKENKLPTLQMLHSHYLDAWLPDSKSRPEKMIEARDYISAKLIEQISSKKNKLIIIENAIFKGDWFCNTSLLEYFLRNEKFKKAFLKNYVFLNRIIDYREVGTNIEFFANHNSETLPKEDNERPYIMERDVEIYIRK